jgi:hypothetical protein
MQMFAINGKDRKYRAAPLGWWEKRQNTRKMRKNTKKMSKMSLFFIFSF